AARSPRQTRRSAGSLFLQAEDGIRAFHVTGVQTCALPIYRPRFAALLHLLQVVDPRALALRSGPVGSGGFSGTVRRWILVSSHRRPSLLPRGPASGSPG